ncbi:integrin alpha-9-like [Amphiura filiformis]|uniref:integrin alpha-9-like n=1 Tax=Amphiura filiformis TaxID=82378 RepID=UPI003B2127A4
MECHIQDKSGSYKLSHKHGGFCSRTFTAAATMSQYKVSPRCTMLTIFMWVLFSANVINVFGCNIDTNGPLIYRAPTADQGFGIDYTKGLFGYSVLQHQGSAENFVLVGAPTANSYFQDGMVERPGVLFLCNVAPVSCFEVLLDDSGNTDPDIPGYKHIKDNAWIGVSVTRQPSSGSRDILSDVTVCGHRYANDEYVQYSITPDDNTTFDANDRFPNGICYTLATKNSGLVDSTITIPCGEYNQTDESTHTRVHGWCQAGMSAQYTSDGNKIMVGAAGSYNWTGTVFESDRIDLNFKPAPDIWGEDDDYTGYAIASGRFQTRDSIQGVASAPRAMRRQKDITTGKVIIYDLETYEVYQELYGDLMNTYYGAAIAAIDLNNDTFTDLLVGAPLYAVEEDEGRVYVYINNGAGQLKPLDFKLSGNNVAGARFGSAIAGAGDLTDDGYEDVVIGAPWEDDNSGAVYVYFGSASGIQMKYSQRLAGREFVPNIKSFGLSVTGGQDSDLNFIPDIVVGAPASDIVILFKTRPVANLEIWLVMNPDPMDPDIQNCELDGKPITCVEVSVCFFYEAPGTPESMDMDVELTADYEKVTQGFPGRFYFLEDGMQESSIYRLLAAKADKKTCYGPYMAYLEKTAEDFLEPVDFHVYYGVHEYPFVENPRGDNPIKFPGGLPPIIDENICGNGTYVEELQFIRDCGSDAICQTDLQLTGEVIFPDGEPYYTLGAYLTMRTSLKVSNVGEEAHDAKVIIRHSRDIRFEALEQSRFTCISGDEASCNIDEVVRCEPVEYINNTAAVECIIGNPMRSMTECAIQLRFDVGGVTYEHNRNVLDFSVEASTISTETKPSNNIYDPQIPVVVLADTTVKGVSDPASVYYESNKTSSENADIFLIQALVAAGVISNEKLEGMKSEYDVDVVVQNVTEEIQLLDEEAIGPPFSLVFEAFNRGPGRLPFDSVVYVSIPWRLSNGDWLIYIKNIYTKGVPATCNIKEILDLQQYRLEEHYVNKTKATAPTRWEEVYEGAHAVASKSSKQLACSNALCVTLKCAINVELQSADTFAVVIESLLWVPTFLESELFLRFKEVVSQSIIEVNAPDGAHRQPEDHEPDYYNLATGVVTDKPPSQPVAWWIILLSILGGFLLLVIIILILYKCGFFKRKTKDEMEKMQQAANL